MNYRRHNLHSFHIPTGTQKNILWLAPEHDVPWEALFTTSSNFKNERRPYPGYYEDKWLAADLSRGWIMAISMKENGDYKSMEKFLPSYQPIEPIDIKFGQNGDLYVLEYGSNWFRKSDNAKLVRIEYNSGNRTPVVHASANKSGGTFRFV